MLDVSKGYMAIAGTKLEGKSDKADEIQIIDALMEVKDPEIPVNLYDLGLIYSIKNSNNNILIEMTSDNQKMTIINQECSIVIRK